MHLLRKMVIRYLLAAPVALALHPGLHAETVARYGISMADIPLTTGQPDRGAGAYQFTGHTVYDPLVAWEANIDSRPGKLVPGLATPAKGQVDVSSPWFGKPTFQVKTDIAVAKALMAQAGYSPSKPLKAKVIIAQGGTGQMLSLPMNEFIQQSLAEVGIQLDFEVVELENLYLHWRSGAKHEMNAGKGISAINLAYVTADPFYAITRFTYSGYAAPSGVNWGGYANPKVDADFEKLRTTFDTKAQDRLLANIHEAMVDDALMLWVVHDVNPHMISPKVKSFVQAQHWFQDLTTIRM